MSRLLFLLAIIFTVSVHSSLPPQNPIIGIYTQTSPYSEFGTASYIAASYVKFIEMSGAQVIPIYAFSETSEILDTLSKINGVLFPGGGMELNIKEKWTKNADTILKYAMQQNDKGNKFPVWATCLGFQLVSYLTGGYVDPLTRVQGDSAIVLPINIKNSSSYLFSTMTPYQVQKMTRGGGILYYNHNWAVTVTTFNNNQKLKNFWNLVATSTSHGDNVDFATTLQAKNYPFFGVQFHPQKNLYEWKVSADRSLQGVEVVQIMSNRFVEVARSNKNRMNNEQFEKRSIYNYRTYQSDSSSFTEFYIFPEKPEISQIRLQEILEK